MGVGWDDPRSVSAVGMVRVRARGRGRIEVIRCTEVGTVRVMDTVRATPRFRARVRIRVRGIGGQMFHGRYAR